MSRVRGYRPSTGAIALCLAAGALLLVAAGLSDDEEEATAPTEPPGTVVWAVGDGAAREGRGPLVARLIAADRPERFLYLGGVYPRGRLDDFLEGYGPVFGRFAAYTAPTPAEQEWRNRGLGYDPYWQAIAKATRRPLIPVFSAPARKRRPPSYFAFAVGGWTLLALNSEAEHGPRSEQVRWLRRQVRRGGDCRIAFWHRPRFTAGPGRDASDLQPLWRLVRRRAALVLSAHDRNMQRLRVDGVTQLIAGAGGVDLQRVPDGGEGRRRAAFVDDRRHGALRLELRPGVARWRFVAVGGRVLDSGSVRCRGDDA